MYAKADKQELKQLFMAAGGFLAVLRFDPVRPTKERPSLRTASLIITFQSNVLSDRLNSRFRVYQFAGLTKNGAEYTKS